jgi:hypothetical protein
MKPLSFALALLAASLPPLFAAATTAESAAPDTSLQVTARLTPPRNVVVEWKNAAGSPAGHIVEYINRPGDEWVILGFVPYGKNTYTHPRLAPGTPYAYRVRPFFGPASSPVEVTVAAGLSDKAYAEAYALPEDYSWAPPQKLSAGAGVIAPKSIRTTATAASAGPASFKAELVKTTVSGFKLTWTDRSSDEEGFLIERIDSPADFTVVAMVEPDINAFGWALEPPARTGFFRVRAYYYGRPSNVAGLTTPADPDDAPSPLVKPARPKTAQPST